MCSDDRVPLGDDIRLLTASPGPYYNARPGSRVPMFTSRCTTPLACALAEPRQESLVGRTSAARFLVSGLHRNSAHIGSYRDLMTTLTHLHTVRPRYAGEHRLAGSWCAPLGATGTRAQWSVDAARRLRGSRMSQQGDRKQQTIAVTFGRTGEFGYRSFDAGRSGAGSGYRGDAP